MNCSNLQKDDFKYTSGRLKALLTKTLYRRWDHFDSYIFPVDKHCFLVYMSVFQVLRYIVSGCSSMAEHQLPKLDTGVRFSVPALFLTQKRRFFTFLCHYFATNVR